MKPVILRFSPHANLSVHFPPLSIYPTAPGYTNIFISRYTAPVGGHAMTYARNGVRSRGQCHCLCAIYFVMNLSKIVPSGRRTMFEVPYPTSGPPKP